MNPFLLRSVISYSSSDIYMKHLFALTALLFSFLQISAQTKVSGIVQDAVTGEPMIGATITYEAGKGVATDLDGLFEFSLPAGTYQIEATYVGYKAQKQEVQVGATQLRMQFLMESETMSEVEIIGDIAIDRKTPVAFSNISPLKLREELGTQDLPMILNTTPGIHATQSGGGDGDSRVTIRGFENRNVAVMVDGIPMNDMENGSVFWSNWFGLDVVTRSMQVQRGLGASKLAIPSIGGTINIMSEGIEEKSKVVIATEYGNNNNARLTVGLNSGRLKNGWGVTSAISARYNEGWVENLGSKQLFYFLKVQKQFEKNSFSLTAMGSPQTHNQRNGRQRIGYYDEEYAAKQGVDTAAYPGQDYGLRHNEFWGLVSRTRFDSGAEEEILSSRVNYYHKPIVNFKHLWTPTAKFALSNVVYASFGNGGGTAASNNPKDGNGQTDFNKLYYENTHGSYGVFNIYFPQYDTSLVNDTNKYKAEHYLLSRENNHVWYGFLSTLKYKASDRLELSGGVDGRYYRTNRYAVIYDLLGADYAVPAGIGGGDLNSSDNGVRYEGDRFDYNIRSYVQQGGVFALAEYKEKRWSAFVNATASFSMYNRVDYYAPKNEDGSFANSGWQNFPAGTIKGGLSFNINEQMSVFANTGFISRAPMMANAFVSSTVNMYSNLENEQIRALEGGYIYNDKKLRLAANGYFTLWNNKPVVDSKNVAGDQYYFNVPGMNARHMGGELEINYKVDKKLNIEAAFSLGDWRWISDGTAIITNESGNVIVDTVQFGANGILVGDAAQLQTSLGIRYSPIKGVYIKPRITYFDKYYSRFDPESLVGEDANRQSWQIPAYYQLDINMGYSMEVNQRKNQLGLKLNLMNVTNSTFITDALNNEYDPNNFDAASAGVYMGLGFRWNVGASYTF